MNCTMKSYAPRGGRWSVAALVAAVGATLAVAQPGCTEDVCSPSDGDNSTPGPAFECATGEVCYLGRCLSTCNAGAELAEQCTSDSDCGGARPNCVRTFCSACVDVETCVPTLDVCRPVTEVSLPELRTRPDLPPAVDRPLDAGFTPGGVLRPNRDAGVAVQPVDREVTRAALIDLGREVDYTRRPPVEEPIAQIRSFDTAIGAGAGLTWRVDVDPPRVQVEFDPQAPDAPPIVAEGFCELRQLQTITTTTSTPTPSSIGKISMVNPADFPGSISPELSGSFVRSLDGYEITPAPPGPSFLTFSVEDPVEPHFVFVSGLRESNIVDDEWPQTADFGHHIPFELVPLPATRDELQAGFQVANPADQDLVFLYNRIETGNDSFEAVFIRVSGERTELFCEQLEGPNDGGLITIRASLLDAFRIAEGLTTPRTYDLYFERASRELLNPPAAPGQVVLITVRIRHSLRTTIRFEP